MIQLNNYSNGSIILVDKMKESGVYYKLYDNPYFKDLGLNAQDKRVDYVSHTFQSALVNPTLEEFINDGCIANILAVETGFEVSTDSQCWLMDIKPIRIVANEKILEHILIADDLGQLFLGLRVDFVEQTYVIDGITFIYVANIDPLYEPILLAYPDTILIENKI